MCDRSEQRTIAFHLHDSLFPTIHLAAPEVFRKSPRYLEEDRPEIWLHLDVIITLMMDERGSPERELLDFMKM
ncbi:hypothetical protein CRENBAI_023241 [Crenichthys baileyi]|uniref:Uncharacterized protein n=1 Tax=Crenichthys baileyi TaxID=28760 RepID=A0AAV9RI64_9TELE